MKHFDITKIPVRGFSYNSKFYSEEIFKSKIEHLSSFSEGDLVTLQIERDLGYDFFLVEGKIKKDGRFKRKRKSFALNESVQQGFKNGPIFVFIKFNKNNIGHHIAFPVGAVVMSLNPQTIGKCYIFSPFELFHMKKI